MESGGRDPILDGRSGKGKRATLKMIRGTSGRGYRPIILMTSIKESLSYIFLYKCIFIGYTSLTF